MHELNLQFAISSNEFDATVFANSFAVSTLLRMQYLQFLNLVQNLFMEAEYTVPTTQ